MQSSGAAWIKLSTSAMVFCAQKWLDVGVFFVLPTYATFWCGARTLNVFERVALCPHRLRKRGWRVEARPDAYLHVEPYTCCVKDAAHSSRHLLPWVPSVCRYANDYKEKEKMHHRY